MHKKTKIELFSEKRSNNNSGSRFKGKENRRAISYIQCNSSVKFKYINEAYTGTYNNHTFLLEKTNRPLDVLGFAK